jgi:hypothetical protein
VVKATPTLILFVDQEGVNPVLTFCAHGHAYKVTVIYLGAALRAHGIRLRGPRTTGRSKPCLRVDVNMTLLTCQVQSGFGPLRCPVMWSFYLHQQGFLHVPTNRLRTAVAHSLVAASAVRTQ